jgi:hemolysin-activating ACP:hemolysin acyltransferase
MDEMDRFTLCGIGGRVRTSTPEFARAALIGLVLQFASQSPYHRNRTLPDIVATLLMAYRLGQLKVYFNDYGECVGYVAWALLSPQVASEFRQTGTRRLESIEWNEGFEPWIVDFLIRPGSLHYVVRDLRHLVFADYASLSYVRARKGVRRLKVFASRLVPVEEDIYTHSRQIY